MEECGRESGVRRAGSRKVTDVGLRNERGNDESKEKSEDSRERDKAIGEESNNESRQSGCYLEQAWICRRIYRGVKA